VRAPILATGFVSVSLAVAPSVGDTLAGEINQRHVAVAHPALLRSLYYSRWNPCSLYSIYDHLEGSCAICPASAAMKRNGRVLPGDARS